jgi:uncharacterized protein (UPF0335 family)
MTKQELIDRCDEISEIIENLKSQIDILVRKVEYLPVEISDIDDDIKDNEDDEEDDDEDETKPED